MPLRLPATAADHQRLARARLPRFLADYVDGGATDEQTLRANEAAWARVTLRQRVLRPVDGVDTRSQLAGEPVALPLALAPIGLAGLVARRGEVQAARAAQAMGLPFTLSTVGVCPLDEVCAAAAPPWFQLYMLRDRGIVRALLQRAWAAGCRTLLFTVDLPVSGMRHRDTRNGLAAGPLRAALIKAVDLAARPGWVWQVGLRGRPHALGNLAEHVPLAQDMDAFKAWVDTQFDPTVTWADIDWLRSQWPGTLVLKGLLDADDARCAVRAGVQALVVSNHGGRQADGVAATATRLPAIARAVADAASGNAAPAEVWVDGGVRSGVDVFRALALGARGVLIGRPWVWALAAGGQAGLERLLRGWQRELQLAMTFAGVTRVADIGAAHLDPPAHFA